MQPLETSLDLTNFRSEFSLQSKLRRATWEFVWTTLVRPSPRPFWSWRRAIISAFGAQLGSNVRIHGSTKIFQPELLIIGDYSVIGPHVDLYNVAPIQIGKHAVVSQYSYLCTATHDHRDPRFPLISKPIVIDDGAWVAADAYIGPGVTVSRGAVVGARASVFSDVDQNTVVGGNPARVISQKHRNGINEA